MVDADCVKSTSLSSKVTISTNEEDSTDEESDEGSAPGEPSSSRRAARSIKPSDVEAREVICQTALKYGLRVKCLGDACSCKVPIKQDSTSDKE